MHLYMHMAHGYKQKRIYDTMKPIYYEIYKTGFRACLASTTTIGFIKLFHATRWVCRHEHTLLHRIQIMFQSWAMKQLMYGVIGSVAYSLLWPITLPITAVITICNIDV